MTTEGIQHTSGERESKATTLEPVWEVDREWYAYHPAYGTLLMNSEEAGKMLLAFLDGKRQDPGHQAFQDRVQHHIDVYASNFPGTDLDNETMRTLLAHHIAGNLAQVQQGLIAELVEALEAMRNGISLDLYRKAAADHGRMQPAQDAWALANGALQHAKEAGYG